jgi:signal peptidase I
MRKLRKKATELLNSANKIYHYRRDVTAPEDLQILERRTTELHEVIKNKASETEAIETAIVSLDSQLRKVGGKLYPKTFLNDNIEVIIVAAIVVIGIRSFFFQPFIIPTNSMYPTYSGMRDVVYAEDQSPNKLQQVFNFFTLGARHYKLPATTSGELSLQYARTNSGSAIPYFEIVQGRKWFGILPAQFKQYTFYVDEVPHSLRVPADFQMDGMIDDLLGEDSRRIVSTDRRLEQWATGRTVIPGDTILSFDITLGDALFVDRLTYHFRKPNAGDPFVFRTQKILQAVGKATGDYTPKYYIKRIGGVENETLEIVDHALLVNGEPRDEVLAFRQNAALEGEYVGYQNVKLLAEGKSMKVPANSFVALGDNSANSADSRYWGFVPQESVIGRAIFIYYPFTKRWGLSE